MLESLVSIPRYSQRVKYAKTWRLLLYLGVYAFGVVNVASSLLDYFAGMKTEARVSCIVLETF